MTTYNIQDVRLLENVYLRLRAWDQKHPNVAAYYDDDKERCITCGSDDLGINYDSVSTTGTSTFQVVTCNNCGKHSRKRVNLRSKEKRNNTLMNI